jgi:hypothetical protein
MVRRVIRLLVLLGLGFSALLRSQGLSGLIGLLGLSWYLIVGVIEVLRDLRSVRFFMIIRV